MKELLIIILVLAFGSGCTGTKTPPRIEPVPPSYGYDLVVWQLPSSNGIRTEFAYNPSTSKERLDVIFKKVTSDWHPVSFTVCLEHGVCVSNTLWLLEMAEKHGITNITVKLNQTRPPRPRSENEKLQQGGPGYPPQGVGPPDP